jgi:hypothetical protein
MATRSGIRPPLQTAVQHDRHASESFGKPYPTEVRAQVAAKAHLGMPQVSAVEATLQGQYKYPSKSTINRWLARQRDQGHMRPYRRTGNSRSKRELRGGDLYNMALYRSVNPKAKIYECKGFVFSANPDNDRPYSDSQISRAQVKITLTRKRASTTADNALLPVNLAKREMYWNENYPIGIADIAPEDILDCDEMGAKAEMCNPKHGMSSKGDRCNDGGVFNHEKKLNVLALICGDPNNPLRFMSTWEGEGTTVIRFLGFINHVIDYLNEHHGDRVFCFTMDNLNTHRNPIIFHAILSRGHKVVFRAPYYAVDGAIEYVFNTLHTLVES